MSRWINGKATPSSANLRSLSEVLYVDLGAPAEDAVDLYVTFKANSAESSGNAQECEILLRGLGQMYAVFSPAAIAPQVHSEAPDIAAIRNVRALLRSHTVVYCQFSEDGRSASGSLK